MVTSRKRKRQSTTLDSSQEFLESHPPPPFAPAHVSLFKNYRSPLSRSLTTGLSPLILNLVVSAGLRLQVRDHASAATILPTLLRRYRRLNNHTRWCFSREVAVTGATVLKRAVTSASSPHLLDAFLAHLASDQAAVSPALEAYSAHIREAAHLDRAIRSLAAGIPHTAYDILSDHAESPSFRSCALAQAYLGIVALAVAARDPDPSPRLRVASRALAAAAALEPRAPFYAYYAAAADVAAGRRDEALARLRHIAGCTHHDDPLILRGLLTCLTTDISQQDTRHSQPHIDSQAVRQERVMVARRLLAVDPASAPAAETLKEAFSWDWNVHPRVTRAEIADVFAGRIEHGEAGAVVVWAELGNCLCEDRVDRVSFWQSRGRSEWWPTHFFRPSRVNAEIANNPDLAAVKGAVAKMLTFPGGSDYAEAVEASTSVDLFQFSRQ